jgi:hypothetical protein
VSASTKSLLQWQHSALLHQAMGIDLQREELTQEITTPTAFAEEGVNASLDYTSSEDKTQEVASSIDSAWMN